MRRQDRAVPNIVVFRDKLLAGSETFILNQGEALKRYTPYYAGRRITNGGLATPPSRTVVMNQGGWSGYMAEMLQYPSGLFERLRPYEPVLMHAHFGPDGFRALPLARSLKVPLVVTFHGYDVTTKDEVAKKSFRAFRNYIRGREQLQQEGALFIAVSNFIREKLVEQGFPEKKTVVHYVGVDNGFPVEPAREHEPVVLFVGRLVENKGCDYLLRAMSVVAKRVKDAQLCIIGDGKLREHLESEARKTLSRVTFLGAQPSHVVRHWMRRAAVLCVPSVTVPSGPSEGFGLVFLEAQAAGLPVASFRTGGIPEAVEHGVTGLLADEYDWNGLANNISDLLVDRSMAERFGRAGIQRTRERFDLHKQTGMLEGMYESVVAGKN